MPSVAGNQILDQWTVLDTNSNPLTGMTVPADLTLTLLRQSGTVMVAASELLSFVEIGSTGRYYFSFTPQFTGLYVLALKELNVLTLGRVFEFRYEVQAAGATFAPSYTNAYCAETDIERYLLQDISSITKPTDVQVAGWAQEGADSLESLCARLGNPITPSSVQAGSRLEGMLRAANAIWAAYVATIVQAFGTAASKTDKAAELLTLWESFYGRYVSGEFVQGMIGTEIQTSVSLATNHTLSGDTIPRDNSNPPQDVGSQITMGDVY